MHFARAYEKSIRVAEIILSIHLEKVAVDREKRPSNRRTRPMDQDAM
jgi:hypothetical protein